MSTAQCSQSTGLTMAARFLAQSPLLILISAPAIPFLALGRFLSLEYWPAALLITFLAIAVAYAALVRAAGSIMMAEPWSVAGSFAATFSNLGPVLAVNLVLFGAVALALSVVAIPLSLYLFVRWFFCVHGVMLRDMTAENALRFSASIVKGKWWLTAIRLSLVLAVSFGANALVYAAATLLSRDLLGLSYVVAAVTMPFAALFHTILFYDLVKSTQPARLGLDNHPSATA